jgi:RNA-directed DNA polymerase
LHEVLDEWFTRQVAPRLAGRAHLIRYADDAIIIFEREWDARRVLAVLPKRLAKYGLTLHPDKTRLVDFRRPDRRTEASFNKYDVRNWPGTFDLLGFTHYWGKSHKGYWVVKRKTAKDRFQRTLKRFADWCRRNRHEPVAEQWTALTRKLLGHFGYFGMIGNSRALQRLRHRVSAVWRKWLSRRSQRARISWEGMLRLLARYPLPSPRILPPLVT